MSETNGEPQVEKLSYTIDMAAEAVSLSRSSIWKMVRRGELWTFKWCGRTLITAEALKAARDRAIASSKGGEA